LLILEQKDFGFFVVMGSRYPLQSSEPNTGSQGFSLLSGLKTSIISFLPSF